MTRPLAILGIGLLLAVGIGAAIVPSTTGSGFVVLLGVVVVGLVITVVAGIRGRRAEADRELARRSRLLSDVASPTESPTPHEPTEGDD